MLSILTGNGLAAALGGIIVAILAAFGAYLRGRSIGRKSERQDAMDEDYENAESIRRRVSVDRDQRVRELDDAGYRD